MKSKEQLFNIIDKFSNYSILVIGDLILDEYIWGKASRLSPEAPVPVLEVNKYSYIPGGAANVANNISALGGKVVLIGVTGDDFQAEQLINTLKNNNIDYSKIIKDKNRLTTVKTRLIAHNHQQLARVDREEKNFIDENTEKEIIYKISEIINFVDLVLLSDYAKGVLTHSLIEKIIKLAKINNKPVLIDPKGLDFTKYTGTTLITPNKFEAEQATKSPENTPPEILAELVFNQVKAEHVLITLGENGVLLYSDNEVKTIPAVTSEVYDVTGAGDSLISAVALGILASDGDFETSVILGNYAAGIAVRKIGTAMVLPQELKNIIERESFGTSCRAG
ncbi:MAG: D-glycero-beta-D-manno-heptose-7-phosphate kinase [bacterium]